MRRRKIKFNVLELMVAMLSVVVLSNIVFAGQAKTYDLFYSTKSGQKLEVTDALLQSVQGQTVYKCQTVDFKVSKAGTSISLKNVKKPKVTKE